MADSVVWAGTKPGTGHSRQHPWRYQLLKNIWQLNTIIWEDGNEIFQAITCYIV